MSAKMGRPRVPKGKQKIPFPIRFERDAIASFKRAAKRERLALKDWVTDALTKAASSP